MPDDYEGSRRQWQDAKSAVENANAIVDAEVVSPWSPADPATVRVHHVLKGNVPGLIKVGHQGAGADCSLALLNVGERRRMILTGGPAIYDLFRDGSEARLEDHFLRSDRRKVWPYVAGHHAEAIQGKPE